MSQILHVSFVPFLESLSFKPSKTGEAPLVVLKEERPARTAQGNRFIIPSLQIYQAEKTLVTINGFRQKIMNHLREANHMTNDSIVDAILGCAVGSGETGSERIGVLEDLLATFCSADVSHFYVFPNSSNQEPLRFDGYHLGKIDLPVLTSRCNRAASDYAQLYAKQLSGRFCLQSPEFRHVVINLLKPSIERDLINNVFWKNLIFNYFEQISHQHFEFMWSHLDRTQMLSMPFSANVLDVQSWRSGLGQIGDRITVYLGFPNSKWGQVVPDNVSLLITSGNHLDSYDRFIDHRTNYRLSEVGESELGRTLYACSGFCQQAIRFLDAGRSDDAALYATICLEHLFSERKSTSDAVCTRTAAVTHLRLSANYAEAEKELRKLYDARSAFVHSGISIKPLQAERLIAYARETIRSLLVLHLKPENRSADFLAQWVKDLDFIVSGINAGKTFDQPFLAASGIFHS